MIHSRIILILLTVILSVNHSFSSNKQKILIVTGGHSFDRVPFFHMFDSFKNISYKELVHPGALGQLLTIELASFDAVVFYDMPKAITDVEKDAFYRLLKGGKGLLFLHHSICAYQDWSEFKNIAGGKYYEKKKDDQFGASSYQHDIDFQVMVEHPSHPVTKGLGNFELHDEVYGNLEVLSGVYPLLSTAHPKSNKLIGWTLTRDNSKIVYLQPGHDANSYNNHNYRKLLVQSIRYITSGGR